MFGEIVGNTLSTLRIAVSVLLIGILFSIAVSRLYSADENGVRIGNLYKPKRGVIMLVIALPLLSTLAFGFSNLHYFLEYDRDDELHQEIRDTALEATEQAKELIPELAEEYSLGWIRRNSVRRLNPFGLSCSSFVLGLWRRLIRSRPRWATTN